MYKQNIKKYISRIMKFKIDTHNVHTKLIFLFNEQLSRVYIMEK